MMMIDMAAAKYAPPAIAAAAAATTLDPAIVVPIVVATVGLIGTVLTVRQSRTEKRVDANRLLTDQLQEQLATERQRGDLLEAKVRDLSDDVGELQYRLTLYRIGAATLTGQIVQLGETPSWKPPKEMYPDE